MNALREGGRSRLWREFAEAVFYAPPGGVERTVRGWLTQDLARHKLFAQCAEVAIEADMPDADRLRSIRTLMRRKPKKDCLVFYQQTGNFLENKALPKMNGLISVDIDENTVLI
jgi:hypothetical protein